MLLYFHKNRSHVMMKLDNLVNPFPPLSVKWHLEILHLTTLLYNVEMLSIVGGTMAAMIKGYIQ